MVHMQS